MTTKVCKVTGKEVTESAAKNYGLFAGGCVKNIYKQCKKDITATKKVLEETCIYIEELKCYFYNRWQTVGKGATVAGFSDEQKKELYDKYFRENTKCILDSCNKKVPVDMTRKGACCLLHYNQACRIKHGATGYDIECKIDGERFNSVNRLSRHILSLGWTLEQYYTTYTDPTADGKCKWCGKQLEFRTLTTGFFNFCHNSSCNVLWHNKYENRRAECSEKVSMRQKETQNMPNQVGYWLKQGYTEKEAREKVRERQRTNTTEAIAKRHNCSIEEAKEIRKSITKKWQKSMPKTPYSRVSQELFWQLADFLVAEKSCTLTEIMFATNNSGEKDMSGKNWEFKLQTSASCRWLDFYVPKLKKIIEFDGVYWHGSYIRDGKNFTRDDVERDKQIKEATGCQIYHVSESDYYEDKQRVVDNCIKFLFEDAL